MVYATDLEKAIEYSIVSEISNQPMLDSEKLSALYLYLDTLVRYAPVRMEIKDFLVSLREWPVRMGLNAVRSQDYRNKV